jgi:hypothetical protein
MKIITLVIFSATIAMPLCAADLDTAGLVKKYDVNGNGKIDVQERKAYLHELSHLRKEAQKRQVHADWLDLKNRQGKTPADGSHPFPGIRPQANNSHTQTSK